MLTTIVVLEYLSSGYYGTVAIVNYTRTELDPGRQMAMKSMKEHYDKYMFGDELQAAIYAGYEKLGPKVYYANVEDMVYVQDLVIGKTLGKVLKDAGFVYNSVIEHHSARPFYDFAKLHPNKAKAFLNRLKKYHKSGRTHGDLYVKNTMLGHIGNEEDRVYAIDFGYGGIGDKPNNIHKIIATETTATFRDCDYEVIDALERAVSGFDYMPYLCIKFEHYGITPDDNLKIHAC